MIRGLKGLTFVDKTDGMKEKTEEREEVRIEGFTDRLYQGAPDEVTLGGLEGGRCLKLTKVRMYVIQGDRDNLSCLTSCPLAWPVWWIYHKRKQNHAIKLKVNRLIARYLEG